MSATVQIGPKIVFGSEEPLPLRGFPQGTVRIKMRVDDFARAYVRCKLGIRLFYIKVSEDGKFWEPAIEGERNFRIRNLDMQSLTLTTDSV